jgi:hypothetical protein
MTKTKGIRNIELSDEVVLALLKQGLDKGFKNFKPYAEYILTEQSKRNLIK